MVQKFVEDTVEEVVYLYENGGFSTRAGLQDYLIEVFSDKYSAIDDQQKLFEIIEKSSNSAVPPQWLTGDIDEVILFSAQACFIREVCEKLFEVNGEAQAVLKSHKLPTSEV